MFAAAVSIIFILTAGRTDAAVRTYYIAADEVVWNYAPTGRDLIKNVVLPSPKPDRIGFIFKKALYREYTDASFRTLKPRSPEDAYLGMLGPVIRAEVGDTIRVVFRNNATHPFSVHPHGVFYTKANEGAHYNDGTPPSEQRDDAVQPGSTYVYRWSVPERAGPGPMDPNSIVWMYHSHVSDVRDVDSGLSGPIIITRKGQLQSNGLPRGVQREVIVSLSAIDESMSWYYGDNISAYVKDPAKAKAEGFGFDQTNIIVTVNGFVKGNMPVIQLHRGEHVRWYLISGMGSDVDFHVLHWHGQTALLDGMRTDMVELPVPGSMRVADMVPDAVGTWLLHCHVPTHITAMTARFKVR
jgi:hephaestin